MPITKKRLQSYIGLRLENENINERIARMQSAAEMPPMSSGDGSQHTSSSGDRMARAVERLIEYKSQVAPTLESNRREMLEIALFCKTDCLLSPYPPSGISCAGSPNNHGQHRLQQLRADK